MRETIIRPNILHLIYPPKDYNEDFDLPNFVDEEIIIEDVVYDLVGAVYGNGSHFFFRFIKDEKVYEAHGMVLHTKLNNRKKNKSFIK